MTNGIKTDAPAIDEDVELDLTIEELDDVSAGLQPAGCMFCAACPVSSFSCFMQ